MFRIRISELEVFYRVGVPDEERAEAQRLLVSIDMDVRADAAASSDDLTQTIDYFEVSQDVLKFGDGRSWKLLERLSHDLATWVLEKYQPDQVAVEIKKFIIPEARFVAVSCQRARTTN